MGASSLTWQYHPGSPLGFPLWLLVLLPFWSCFVTFVISRLGWSKLAAAHPGGARPTGRTFRGRSGRVGLMMSYNNCLNVTLSGEGIYVIPMWIFRLFHPPLLLPWSGVKTVGEARILFWRQIKLRYEGSNGPGFTLYLPADASADIRALSGRPDFSASLSQ